MVVVKAHILGLVQSLSFHEKSYIGIFVQTCGSAKEEIPLIPSSNTDMRVCIIPYHSKYFSCFITMYKDT